MRTPFAVAALLAAASGAIAQDQQVGARTKAMGGSYTAFEDDPVSVWLNPAGISTQPDALSVAYQTFTAYELQISSATFAGEEPEAPAEAAWADPALIPSYLGLVFQLGTPEQPQAVGLCFTSPFQLKFPFSQLADDDVPGATLDQTFYRFRVTYGRDFRFRPAGAEGFLTHVAAGLGIDYSVTRVRFKEYTAELLPDPVDLDTTDTGLGGGAGLLVGVFDNTRTFKLNFGAAYQSKVHYDFSLTSAVAPLFHWPNQYQVGLTAYLLEGLPLRLTLDAQIIEWDRATKDATVPGAPDFENVVNYSLGAEYRIKASEAVTLYPRAGLRLYDAPWDSTSRQELPAIRDRRIIIDPDDDEFVIGSVGLGIAWASEAGKNRSVDVAFDFGGDATGFAVGFTLEL